MLHLMLVVGAPVDPVPDAEDVTAGWGAFAVFIALGIAVALLGFSLIRHLRKARANADAGMFEDSDEERHPTV